MSSKHSFIKRAGGKVIVDCWCLDIRIPKAYFELGIAEMVGDKLNTLGIFRFRVRATENGPEKKYIMNLPSPISVKASEEYSATEEGVEAEDAQGVPEPLRVFRLNRGDILMESESIIMNPKNVHKFAELLHSGHLPKTTYEAIFSQYTQVQADNKTNLNVPSSTIEGIIAEICRSARDRGKPFRIALGAGAKDSAFIMAGLKSLPHLLSTFSGVAFEDINRALSAGIARTRRGDEELITPMEMTIKA
jgi:hypothetical protein